MYSILMTIRSKYNTAKEISRNLHVSMPSLLISFLLKRNLEVKLAGSTISISPFNAYVLGNILSRGWKVTGVQGYLVTLTSRDGEVSITCRTNKGNDLGHIMEIFLDNSYNYDVRNKVVIDVGASNGDSSIFFAKRGAKRIIALEPDEESYALATRNVEASRVGDQVILLNKALSSQRGKITLYVYENSVNGNSIDPQNMVKLGERVIPKTVESVTLTELLDMAKDETVGLLKMDCEGCEYSVLNNLEREAFERIEAIFMEYHNGLQNLKSILESNGFQVEVIGENNRKMGYIRARKLSSPFHG
ncbi:methyltransferase FkbM family [Metallosphaera sedula]|uniref:Methyltransferase FkbM family n=6 Tax=Metallosphaera TaxID=41980 RepID=A4YHT7_METS5|nr:methyltransferase FkbM family [Metallosphaera sedula DSM 5348]AIM27973.1 methyltransferase FkbM family [Metallosphaera sedula]QCO30602.1 FkbM family methyltransferase [Metallosphaera prunae]